MRIVILGTDHDLQCSDQGLRELITQIVKQERVSLLAEENLPMSNTIARQVSEALGVPWIQIDMSNEDRIKGGIYEKLANRMQVRYDSSGNPIPRIRYAPKEDGIREHFWLDRIEEAGADDATVLIICGCVHCKPLAAKAETRLHVVSKVLYPENLSNLTPELY